jgi:hypothetical protein
MGAIKKPDQIMSSGVRRMRNFQERILMRKFDRELMREGSGLKKKKKKRSQPWRFGWRERERRRRLRETRLSPEWLLIP